MAKKKSKSAENSGFGTNYTIQAIGANNTQGESRNYYMLPYIVPKLRRNVTQLALRIMDEVSSKEVKKFKQMQFLNHDTFALIASNINWLAERDYLSRFVACFLLPENVSIIDHNQAHIENTAEFIDLYMPHNMQMEATLNFFAMLDFQAMLIFWKSIQPTLSNLEMVATQDKK